MLTYSPYNDHVQYGVRAGTFIHQDLSSHSSKRLSYQIRLIYVCYLYALVFVNGTCKQYTITVLVSVRRIGNFIVLSLSSISVSGVFMYV